MIEGYCIFEVRHSVAEPDLGRGRTNRHDDGISLATQGTQHSQLSKIERPQVSNPLEIEESSIQLQDPNRVNDQIFGALRNERGLLLQPIEPPWLSPLWLDHPPL